MASKIDIINMALANIGQNTVTTLEDDSKTSFMLRVHYDIALDDLLRSHSWGFATRRTDLEEVAETPLGYAHSYRYPADCAIILRLIDREKFGQRIPFVVARSVDGRSRVILTNCPEWGWLEYVTNLVEPTEFDPKFTIAFSWRLAATLAQGVYNDRELHQNSLQLFAEFRKEAMEADAEEVTYPDLPDGNFIKARSE